MVTNFGKYMYDNKIDINWLANRIGVKVETLRKYESGSTLPRWEIAKAIGELLPMEKEDFLKLFDFSY